MSSTTTTVRSTRVHPLLLAAAVSIVAVAVALTAHLAFGVGETPIVIGTLVVASILGWLNAERGTADVTPMPRGGHRVDTDGFSHAA